MYLFKEKPSTAAGGPGNKFTHSESYGGVFFFFFTALRRIIFTAVAVEEMLFPSHQQKDYKTTHVSLSLSLSVFSFKSQVYWEPI